MCSGSVVKKKKSNNNKKKLLFVSVFSRRTLAVWFISAVRVRMTTSRDNLWAHGQRQTLYKGSSWCGRRGGCHSAALIVRLICWGLSHDRVYMTITLHYPPNPLTNLSPVASSDKKPPWNILSVDTAHLLHLRSPQKSNSCCSWAGFLPQTKPTHIRLTADSPQVQGASRPVTLVAQHRHCVKPLSAFEKVSEALFFVSNTNTHDKDPKVFATKPWGNY